MRRTSTLYQEYYKCLKCGTIRQINRSAKKKIGHLKHMMCAGCYGRTSKFIKISW